MEKIKFKGLSVRLIEDPSILRRWRLMRKLSIQSCKMALKYRKKLDTLQVDYKSERDLVSEADKAIELLIRRAINSSFPDDAVIGEEYPNSGEGDYCWIVDPIDGTTSFVRGQWHYSISIALQYRGQLVMGAVTAPELGHFFSAAVGCGAWLNGRKITVSNRATLSDSVFTTGFACIRKGHKESNLKYFPYFAEKLISSRRFGSAALDCCYVAMGVLDGFWELGLNLYDIAAGVVIAREAGALASDFSGGEKLIPSEILIANKQLHRESLELIREVRKISIIH